MGLFDDVAKAVGDVVTQPVKTVTTVVEKANEEATKVAAQAGGAIEEGAQNLGKEAEKGVQNIGKEAEKGVQNVGHTLEKAGQDVGKALGQASNDTVAQLGRSYGDVVELAEASYHFIENQVQGYEASVKDAAKRLEEGKLVDAVWGAMTDPAKVTEQAAADAVMESSLLNSLAAAGATVYGGPAGAAAYAAWYTYKATGNLEAALKAGAIAWATSSTGKAAAGIDGNGWDAITKRTLSCAAIGGASVAAAGGSDEQVLAAFGKGAVIGAAREVYKAQTGQKLDGKPATKPPVLKDTPEVKQAYGTLPNGNIVITNMPPEISHVGMSTGVNDTSYFGVSETAGVMQDLSQLPYVNDMAYFHDQWVAMTNMQGVAVQVTILPAIAFTGTGSEGELNNLGTQQTVEDEKEKHP